MPIRKVFFWSHLVLGLVGGALIAFMALTGMILAFEHQILDATQGHLQRVAQPETVEKPLPVDSLVAQARAQGVPVEGALLFRSNPEATVQVLKGRDVLTYLDPWTGKDLGGPTDVYEFLHTVEDLHRWLGVRDVGKPITGTAVLIFLGLSLSGLILWWPRKSTAQAFVQAARPRWKLRGAGRDWNWHTTLGFLFLPVLLSLSTTGAILSWDWANKALHAVLLSPPPMERKVPPKHANRDKRTTEVWVSPHLQSALDASRERVQKWQTMTLRWKEPNAPIEVLVRLKREGMSATDTLRYDSKSGQFLSYGIAKVRTDLGYRVRLLVKPLHTGELLGLPGQILVFLGAGVTLILVWTGFALSWRRYRRARAKKEA